MPSTDRKPVLVQWRPDTLAAVEKYAETTGQSRQAAIHDLVTQALEHQKG